MGPAIARTPAPLAFEDGLGQRHHSVDAENTPIEILTLRDDLIAVPAFEFALRERVARLSRFRHACYGTVRGVERVDHRKATLAIVSDRVLGDRLSDILSAAERHFIPLEINAALCLVRQLVHAIAILHETVRDACHGAIAPERIIITPDARVVVVEHVLGGALGTLARSRDQYWKELRIPLPPTAGAPRFDARADVTQIGAVAMALILGRPLGGDDYPARVGDIAARIGAVSAGGGLEPLPDAVRTWLLRALQLVPQTSFASAVEAQADFDRVLGETGYPAAPATLKAFLAQCAACAAAAAPKPEAPQVETRHDARPHDEPPQEPPPFEAPLERPAPQPAPALSGGRRHFEAPAPKRQPASRWRLAAAAVALIALASGGTLAARYYLVPEAAVENMGTLTVATTPEGVAVMIDGQYRGTTPVSAQLPPGEHLLELVLEGERRTIPVTIRAGGQVSQVIELPKIPVNAGQLQVRTEPAGARVTIDGQAYGVSPLTIPGLTPGPHTVVLENDARKLSQEVMIEPGAVASLVVPMATASGAPLSGWISVAAPADVQIYENDRLVGSSLTDRIMVPAGRHEFEIVNEALGYRGSRTVTVSPGQVFAIRLEWPRGSLALNALPWAEVWIGKDRIGETPLGNLSVPIGTHEVIFRHPELGEQRHRVDVTLTRPARLSVDMRTK